MSASVVAIMAHPDDIEIHLGGILCLLKDRGWELHFVTVCQGDVGSATLSPSEIAAVRRSEAQRAAEIAGATYDCLGVGDLRLTFDPGVKGGLVGCLRRYQAGAVLTHAAKDYMADHELTAALAREACFAAPAPNWPNPDRESWPPLPRLPELYHADPTAQIDGEGKFVPMPIVIDISSVIDRKAELLRCHESQREWLRRQHGEDDYLESMRRWARLRGHQIGVAYGEGLRQHFGHPFPPTSTLVDALGGSATRILR